ncbi:MAG: right-handed parallel beta-helix repeat-containing protein, partial [Candidatus Saccharimonas sp.]|nr:right-handed parallel beta-helix repeat-containing protein [Planctomycetaceae bacterium]
MAEPWDLSTALVATEIVKPGDTVWIHAGTYRGGFVSRLSGRPGTPVVVRGERGGRVTIDTQPRDGDERDNGLFLMLGADAVYRDFEVTCSHPLRETKIAGSWPADIRRGNIDVRGDRVSVVNLVVHDCGSGFGFWAEGEGGEISGCLIYNNGWRGPDRGHGHAIYAQNARGTKRIVDNVVFHQFAYGIHVYGSEKASLKGFEIDGNIAFENGCLTRKGDNAPGIMVGGGSAAERIAVRDNVIVGGGIRLGYPWGTISEDVVCTGNYSEGLVLRDFRKATVMHNTLVASSTVVSLEGAERLLLGGLRWNENDYHVTDGRWGECSVVESAKSRGLSFTQWRETTGLDSKSTFTKGAPSKSRVIVRPNAHEPGRAHLAVLNPQKLPEVEVDLSRVLKSGQRFRIVSVKDVFGEPLVSGLYEDRPVRVPMKPVTSPQPVGMPNAELPVTEPHFAAFVVLPEQGALTKPEDPSP